MLPKKGIILPGRESLGSYPRAIAYALKCELGTTHQAVKVIMGWTGAGERTVKNWLAGTSGPSGQHLVELIRRSEQVLAVLLVLAGREQAMATQALIDARNKLEDAVEQIDALVGKAINGNGRGASA